MVRSRTQDLRDRGSSAVATVIAASAVAVVLLTVVASSGVVRVWSEPPPVVSDRTAPVVLTPEEAEVSQLAPSGFSDDLTPPDTWWWRVVVVLVLLALLWIAWVVVSVYWQVLHARLTRRTRLTGSLTPLPGSNATDDAEVSFDLDAGLMHLRGGDPRNAIVACWMRLEDDVAANGLPRRPSETSVEYTQRVLAAASLDASATLELAELYREARFSDHPVDDRGRERAIDALRRVHSSLRVRESGGVP